MQDLSFQYFVNLLKVSKKSSNRFWKFTWLKHFVYKCGIHQDFLL